MKLKLALCPKTAVRSQIKINKKCFLGANLPTNRIWSRNFKNLWFQNQLFPDDVCQFSGKIDNFNFFGTNLPKNKFWGRNFENLSPDSQSAPLRYHVCQFSGKTDSFEFSWPKLWKLPN